MKNAQIRPKQTQVQTLSLRYIPKEDRMKLIINLDNEQIVFWITRHFYLSTLFDLETFCENHNITYIQNKDAKQEKNKKQEQVEFHKNCISHTHLLDQIKIRLVNENKGVVTIFKSGDFELRTVFGLDKFIELYGILKRNYPQKMWGIL